MDEEVRYVLVAVGVFFVVWIGCMVAWGPMGFMLGWMPALVIALIWPLVLGVASFAVAAVLALGALLYVCSQMQQDSRSASLPASVHVGEVAPPATRGGAGVERSRSATSRARARGVPTKAAPEVAPGRAFSNGADPRSGPGGGTPKRVMVARDEEWRACWW